MNELIWTPGASTLFEAKTAGFQLQNRRKQAAKSVDVSGVRFDSFTSRKSIRPETKTSDPDTQQPSLPMQMRLDDSLPKLKPLRFNAGKGKISLLLAHGFVKDGTFIPMQLAPDAFAQSN